MWFLVFQNEVNYKENIFPDRLPEKIYVYVKQNQQLTEFEILQKWSCL